MGVPFRNMLAAGMILAATAASAAEGAVSFSGVVPAAPLWPARAAIASFADRAAIDITLSNPHDNPATARLSASPGASVPRAVLHLPPRGLVRVRAFIDLGDDAARPATICAIIASGEGSGSSVRACGDYLARRFNID